MLVKQLKNPHVLYQVYDPEIGIPEAAIAASTDESGLIVLNQEGRDIVVNPQSVPALCKLLRTLAQGD